MNEIQDPLSLPQEPAPPPKRNIKLVIAYNGAAYHGWQRQAQFITIGRQG